MKKPTTKRRSTTTAIVLVFEEDDHDRECIKILLEGLRPDTPKAISNSYGRFLQSAAACEA